MGEIVGRSNGRDLSQLIISEAFQDGRLIPSPRPTRVDAQLSGCAQWNSALLQLRGEQLNFGASNVASGHHHRTALVSANVYEILPG